MGLFWGGCKRLNIRFTWNILSWSCDTSFIFPQLCHVSLRWCNHSPLLLSLSAMATYPPTCSNTNTSQGMNMANSIANLRLKAKEYSLNQVPTVNWEEGERLGGGEAREGRGPSLPSDPCRRDTVSGMRTTSTHPRSLDRFYTYMQKCWTASDAGFSPQAAFYFFLFWFFFSLPPEHH